MSKSILTKHYRLLLAKWPPDLLRPTVSLPKTVLQHRIDAFQQPPSSSPNPSPASTKKGGDNVVANGALASIPATTTTTSNGFDEKAELEQVNVLYSFLEDRYRKRYPLSPKMMQPASNPKYYTDLIKELDEAPKRSWLQSKIKKLRGMIRLR